MTKKYSLFIFLTFLTIIHSCYGIKFIHNKRHHHLLKGDRSEENKKNIITENNGMKNESRKDFSTTNDQAGEALNIGKSKEKEIYLKSAEKTFEKSNLLKKTNSNIKSQTSDIIAQNSEEDKTTDQDENFTFICQYSNQYYLPTEKTCVYNCPTNFYNSINNLGLKYCELTPTSLPSCPSGTIFSLDLKVCVSECPKTSYKSELNICLPNYSENFKCVNPNSYLTTSLKKCFPECPPGYYPDHESNECFTEPKQLSAIKLCERGKYYYEKGDVCVLNCPEGYVKENNFKVCLKLPPKLVICEPNADGNITYYSESQKYCQDNCYTDESPVKFGEGANYCIPSLPKLYECKDPDFFLSLPTQTCDSDCPGYLYTDYLTMNCTEDRKNIYKSDTLPICSNGDFYIPAFNICTETCPSDLYPLESLKICVHGPKIQSKFCLEQGKPYLDDFSKECVSDCPKNTAVLSAMNLCYYFPTNLSRSCPNQAYYKLNNTESCFEKCPAGTFPDHTRKLCLQEEPFYTNLKVCEEDLIYNERLGVCVEECDPQTEFFDKLLSYCRGLPTFENNCKENTPYYLEEEDRCVSECRDETSTILPNIKYCIRDPKFQTNFACADEKKYIVEEDRTCFDECPPGTHSDHLKKICLSSDSIERKEIFVCEKASEFYLESNSSCVEVCPPKYFKNTKSHIRYCLPIPPERNITCDSDRPYYIEEYKSCVEMCPEEYIETNENECLPGFATQNITCSNKNLYYVEKLLSCLSECPEGTLLDEESRRCVSTQKEQITVLHTDLAMKCENSEEFYMPWEKTCLDACPSGTYVLNQVCLPQKSPCSIVNQKQTFLDFKEKKCVETCSESFIKDEESKYCLPLMKTDIKEYICGDGFLDEKTGICHLECPLNQIPIYGDHTCTELNEKERALCEGNMDLFYSLETKECLEYCPKNTYVHLRYCSESAHFALNDEAEV